MINCSTIDDIGIATTVVGAVIVWISTTDDGGDGGDERCREVWIGGDGTDGVSERDLLAWLQKRSWSLGIIRPHILRKLKA